MSCPLSQSTQQGKSSEQAENQQGHCTPHNAGFNLLPENKNNYNENYWETAKLKN